MDQEKFSPEESIRLIHSMIQKTKQDISDKSIYFLVWGWLTFIACTGQFILKHVYNYKKHYQVWLLIVVGVVFSIYWGMRQERTRRMKTYIGDSIKHLWIGMGIGYFVLCAVFFKVGWETTVYPFFMLLYGLGTFISGSILQFRPLVIGGLIAWALAIGAAFVEYDYQMLFAATAILISYIIPAYLLRSRNKMLHA